MLTDLKRDGAVEFSHKPVGVKEGDREQDEGEEGEEEKEDVGEGKKGEENKERE